MRTCTHSEIETSSKLAIERYAKYLGIVRRKQYLVQTTSCSEHLVRRGRKRSDTRMIAWSPSPTNLVRNSESHFVSYPNSPPFDNRLCVLVGKTKQLQLIGSEIDSSATS